MSLSGGITNQKPVVIAVAWLLFFGGLAGLSYWNDHRIAAEPDILAQRDVRQIGLAIEKPIPKYETKQIGEIRPIVDWVLAANPEMTVESDYVDETGRYITDFGPLGPPDWRVVHFRLWKETGGDLNIWLGRPLWYWEELGATSVGQTVWLNFEEFGAVGNAEVISINQCLQPPPRPTDRHFLVTGRFVHSSVDFLRLLIAGVAEPLDATADHPFWSEDRRAFVAAGDLRRGEALRLDDGSSTYLVHSEIDGRPRGAYNIEVDGQHVFFVSQSGILVHNACTIRLQPYRRDVLVKGVHGDALNNGRKITETRLRVRDGVLEWFRWGDKTNNKRLLKDADKAINELLGDPQAMNGARGQIRHAIADMENDVRHGTIKQREFAERNLPQFREMLRLIDDILN